MNNYGKIKTINCKGTAGDLVTNADIAVSYTHLTLPTTPYV